MLRTLFMIILQIVMVFIGPKFAFADSDTVKGIVIHVWNYKEVRAQGNFLLKEIFPKSDSRRNVVEEALLAGDFDFSIEELTDEEINIICDYREWLKNQSKVSSSCPERTLLGSDPPSLRIDINLQRVEEVRQVVFEKGTRNSSTVTRPSVEELSWNFWVEEGDSGKRKYSAVDHLIPWTAYRLFINLSALKYRGTGVVSQHINKSLKEELENLVFDLNRPDVELTALIAVHPSFFELPKVTAMKVRIDLEEIREYLRGKVKLPSNDPFTELQELARQLRDPNFVFADSHFKLRARGKQGMTDVVIAFAKDGVPLGSVSIPLCIATASTSLDMCKAPSLSTSSTDIDVLRIATEGARQPAASLQFVETRSGPVMGMLRTFAGKEAFYFWPLSINGEKLRATLRDTIAPNLSRSSATEKDLHTYGFALMNALFPLVDLGDAASNDAAEKAREAFNNVVNNAIKSQEQYPHSIFIRMDYENVDEPVFLPMGFMPISTDEESPDFVGFHFSINVPLTKQDYQVSSECRSRWHLAIPRIDETDKTIQETLGRLRIDTWNEMATNTFDDMGKFINWVKRGETPSGTLMVLSHQDKNTISFRRNGRTLPRRSSNEKL